MSSVHSILKSFTVAGFLVIGLSVANASFAQTSESPSESSFQEEDDEAAANTVKITRRVSSVSKGYRIQIFSGADREAAKATKISFMKRFPSVRSYISYEVPYYKIKVGDFKTRKEAMDFHRYLSKTYSTTIVPSLINNRIPAKYKAPAPVAPKPEDNPSATAPAEAAK